jgi:hypothetical protein
MFINRTELKFCVPFDLFLMFFISASFILLEILQTRKTTRFHYQSFCILIEVDIKEGNE